MPLSSISEAQNPDGGWPYQGASSWTEPTAYALLAHLAWDGPAAGRERGLAWLRRSQRPDGGWAPHAGVPQSTWVTGLVALLPPEWIGPARHARALDWLLGQSGRETAPLYRIREWLLGHATAPADEAGWPWYPGSAAWVIPTSLALLALQKAQPRRAEIPGRIATGRRYLLEHRCQDGGWNHGSARALGYASNSYPETTGLALLALRGASVPAATFDLARRQLEVGRSSEGASWLRLALLAHGQKPAPIPEPPRRTLRDGCLALLADAAGEGRNVFLDRS